MSLADYDALARVFQHPSEPLEPVVAAAIGALAESYPKASEALERFLELLPKGELLDQQELHTRTFDVQAITSLDIGYTLFGEDYKRGALLANLSSEHQRAGTDCGTELGDHLPNVLRLLPRLRDEALRAEFVEVLLAPAVREMIREFDAPRLAKKEELYKKHHKTLIVAADGERRTAYRLPLEALYEALVKDFALKTKLPLEQSSKFAGSIGTEMGIESCGGCAAK